MKIKDAERHLNTEEIRALLDESAPQAVKACETDAEVIMLCQEAFGTSIAEMLLLGALVKYAGLRGKNVDIVASKQEEHSVT